MTNNDSSFEDYRRAEAELAERLDETRRAVEEAEDWERTRQTLRERGVLDWVDSELRKIHKALIRSERRRGKLLRDARLYADGVMARVRACFRYRSDRV